MFADNILITGCNCYPFNNTKSVLYHAIRLVDAEAGTKAFTLEGKLYNEPKLPSMEEADEAFQDISFPIEDGSIDTGLLILRPQNSERIHCKVCERVTQ